MKIELFYDKECPFCKFYANYIKVKNNHNLILKNIRDEKEYIQVFNQLGLDVNDGFIIKIDDDKVYQGTDAIIFLNTISKKNVYFKDNIIFKYFVYPFVKQLRKLVLFCLGKDSKL